MFPTKPINRGEVHSGDAKLNQSNVGNGGKKPSGGFNMVSKF